MKFTRTLKPAFIKALNELYTDKNSWWRTIADDKDVFILIRNNEIRVQVNGGLLLQVNQDVQSNLICKMHEDFLSLRSANAPYVTLGETATAPIKRVEGLKGLVDHYSKVKRRIKIFTGRERQIVQHLANNKKQVVDIEIGFEGELKEGAKKKSVPRIDMAAITNSGTLVFFEVKLFDNSEIRSQKTPKVVGQLKKYEDLLTQYGKDIIAGYKQQMNVYSQLKGGFFKNRVRSFSKINLHPQARLIITGFDGSQQKHMLPVVKSGIEEKYEWQDVKNDLIATGNYTSLIKNKRLFLGLK